MLSLAMLGGAFLLPAQAELKGKNEVTVQAGAMFFEGDTNLIPGVTAIQCRWAITPPMPDGTSTGE